MSEVNETAKRPAFLTVLCILSFIAAGIGIISMIIMSAARGVVDAAGSEVNNKLNDELAKSGLDMNNELNQAIVLILVGLWGVIKMWKLQKQGYYIYAATQVVGVIVPLIFGITFSTFGAIMAVLFIVLYGLNLKHMS